MAALLVMVWHCGGKIWYFLFEFGGGITGVALFFSLSGYLLTAAFLGETRSLPRGAKLLSYWTNRLFRILPMYLFYAGLTQWLYPHPQWKDAVWNMQLSGLGVVFWGHLWTLAHEIVFYLLLPLIAIPLAFLCPSHFLRGLVLIAIACAIPFIPEQPGFLRFAGYDTKLTSSFFITPFLFGMAGRYLAEGTNPARMQSCISKKLFSYTGVILFPALFFFVSRGMDDAWAKHTFWSFLVDKMFLYGMIGGCVVAWAALLRNGLPYRFLAHPILRSIGIVGYSFYLWHIFVITYLTVMHRLEGAPLIIGTFIITYLLSCITFTLIEYPMMRVPYLVKKLRR